MANSGNVFSSFDPHPGERRRGVRHAFTATADIMDPRSHLQISRAHFRSRLSRMLRRYAESVRRRDEHRAAHRQGQPIVQHNGDCRLRARGHGHGSSFRHSLARAIAHSRTLAGEAGRRRAPDGARAARYTCLPCNTPVPVAAPAPKHEVTPAVHAASPTATAEKENTEVLKYLVLMLVKKGVLVEFEGQALLERLLG